MRRAVGFWTLLDKEIKRFLKVLGKSLFTPIVVSLLYFLIFGIGLGRQLHEIPNFTYLEFLIPGMIMMGLINHSFLNPSSSLLISKIYGDIEDLKTSPLGKNEIIWAMAIAGAFRGVLIGIVVTIVGEFCLYFAQDTILFPTHLILMFFILVMTGITFSLLGFAAGMVVRSFEALNSLSQFILIPLLYLGGIFYSVNRLPALLQKVAIWNPIFYYINGIRYAFLGIADISLIGAIVIPGLFIFLAYILAFLAASKSSYRHF